MRECFERGGASFRTFEGGKHFDGNASHHARAALQVELLATYSHVVQVDLDELVVARPGKYASLAAYAEAAGDRPVVAARGYEGQPTADGVVVRRRIAASRRWCSRRADRIQWRLPRPRLARNYRSVRRPQRGVRRSRPRAPPRQVRVRRQRDDGGRVRVARTGSPQPPLRRLRPLPAERRPRARPLDVWPRRLARQGARVGEGGGRARDARGQRRVFFSNFVQRAHERNGQHQGASWGPGRTSRQEVRPPTCEDQPFLRDAGARVRVDVDAPITGRRPAHVDVGLLRHSHDQRRVGVRPVLRPELGLQLAGLASPDDLG